MQIKTNSAAQRNAIFAIAQVFGAKFHSGPGGPIGTPEEFEEDYPQNHYRIARVSDDFASLAGSASPYQLVTIQEFLDAVKEKLETLGKEQIKVGEYTAEIKEDGVQVGCTFVDRATVNKIHALLNK